MKAKIIAEVIPVAVKSNIPINIPIKPISLALCRAPCIRECPKERMGSWAPPPTIFIILS